ncbi:MAG: DUF1206 domain-containing protein [Candidatus Undinarchaeales archaeon]
MSEEDISKKEEKEKLEEELEEEEQEEEQKKEEFEESLEELEKAVEAEVTEEKDTIEEVAKETEGPITLFLKSPEVSNQAKKIKKITEGGIKGITENGVAKTHKNVIVFYEHATSWGDRIRGLIFFLLGLSVLGTGLLATHQDYFSLTELISIIFDLAGGWLGRIIVAAIGVSLVAYGLDKMLSGLKDKLFPKKEEGKPYVQKKLVEDEK